MIPVCRGHKERGGTITVKEAIKDFADLNGFGIMAGTYNKGYRRTEAICGRAVGEYTNTSIRECVVVRH
ncbi:MAG: hypothetical protein HS132_06845 [Planctomycetia bacterium]|nr:hypothetical protein [Planctomycetia bacterium]